MIAIVIKPGQARPLIWNFDSGEALRAAVDGEPELGWYKSYAVLSSADPHATPNRTLDGRTFCGTIIITSVYGLGLAEALDLREDCAAWPQARWGCGKWVTVLDMPRLRGEPGSRREVRLP